jgi:hypothetical protein
VSPSGGTATRSSPVPAPTGAMPSRARVISQPMPSRRGDEAAALSTSLFGSTATVRRPLDIRSYPKFSVAFSGNAKQPILRRTSHQNRPSPAPAQAAPLGRSDSPDATTAHFFGCIAAAARPVESAVD